MDKQQLFEFIEYYRLNPDSCIEDVIGIKLLPYQKLMLKMTKNNNHILFGRHNGRDFCRKLQALTSLSLLGSNETISVCSKDGIKEMSRDEAFEMIYKQLYKQ